MKLALGRHNTHLFTLDRNPTTDQSTDTTKVQLGKPMSFIGVTYRTMGEGLLTRAEMTQRQVYLHSPPSAWVRAHKSWDPGNTAHLADGSTGCRVSFPSEAVALNLFQAAVWCLLLPGSWSEFDSPESLPRCSAPFHLRGTLSFYCLLWQGGA